ncbi:molecular chaperone Hsp33 [Caminicella sporogenes DSM 14501]|uniref:33 kDa chaperonin n=1 Tax=Caminicella sporogenes DSM 14501 TaxID=1121266 RepID=A0A1M6R544_9FIRM|nr:Hsp33 family molecular chaperone HslO [Caminicella sporogenes]RKD27309.1 Hsp33 family molecular chaperone [Caminicella sporogenes]SHK27573.1 molecular chaperone Hsp33 [Caminicella sporogenes DSM 14501]
MKNYIVRGLAGNKNIRVFVAITTEMVEKARKIHKTTPVSTAALGRTITAASIMGYMLKGEKDKLTLQILGSNEIKSIVAVSDSTGNVKAYISNPNAKVKLNDKGKLDVGGAVGRGKLRVIKDLGLKEPYIGQANLISGEIAEDLAAYYMYSEQQPSVVSLGVLIDVDGSVKAAGGFIIQPLPDVEEEILIKLEECIKDVPPVSAMVAEGLSGEEIMRRILKDFDVEVGEKKEVDFVCDCSLEKIERALISLGEEELKNIIEEDEEAEIQCHFCNTFYKFNKEQLIDILKRAKN